MRHLEILAPAGSAASLAAALAAGADAVYFGTDEGWNARARADNFRVDDLPAVMRQIHRAGARGYLTLNTLVFEPELGAVERIVRAAAAAGVDALIVQDPAVALIARALCPQLDLHASTQMTLSAPAAAAVAARLGISRIVVPRELSVDEIRAFAAASPIELEVFIHGALCVSWSGQCLTSESWGGRSANRGQCAQSCRLPYDLVVDGEARDLGEVRYLLSPQDLAGATAVPALAEAGVACLKIEGRQKGPAYVAATVAGYRAARDAAAAGADDPRARADELAAMGLAYTRGPSLGFLGGVDHQRLVVGRAPKHRGLYLGRVVAVGARTIEVRRDDDGRPWTGGLALGADRPAAPTDARPAVPEAIATPLAPTAGLGVVFDDGHPETDEQGGPIFAVDELGPDRWLLGFGTPGPDLGRVAVGARVWVTSDPAQHRAAERLVATTPDGRIALALVVTGADGAPLTVTATAGGATATAASAPLTAARGHGLEAALLADKLGALGGTRFHLAGLDAAGLAPGLHLPVSALKELRRQLVAALDAALDRVDRAVRAASVVSEVRAAAWAAQPAPAAAAPAVVPLCRQDDQLDAVLAAGAPEVELDWMELVGLARAVARARAAGARVVIATPRVIKPGEERILEHLLRLEPDAVLVRSWAAAAALAGRGPALHGDFSLNVTNSVSAGFALGLGLATVTAAHDLDATQLAALLAAAPVGRFAVTVHHHIPSFHTEHCVYAHLLSGGRDYRSCGRPCEAHQVALRDRTGLVHPVVVDVGCRNTVFGAQAQSAAGLVKELVAQGVARLRVEFVREAGADAARVWGAYRDLAASRTSVAEVVKTAAALEQFGVTRGTMRVIS
ncbi:MAG: U32 family peptidase [Myxococcales bacterium]|nr:U32 family peptidase [Myxococcales bacterium]MBK7197206.1 U32 family peptidase [Myxococcales bacterium]